MSMESFDSVLVQLLSCGVWTTGSMPPGSQLLCQKKQEQEKHAGLSDFGTSQIHKQGGSPLSICITHTPSPTVISPPSFYTQ